MERTDFGIVLQEVFSEVGNVIGSPFVPTFKTMKRDNEVFKAVRIFQANLEVKNNLRIYKARDKKL